MNQKRRLKDGVGRLRKLFSTDIWDVELSSLSKLARIGARALRVVHLVFRGFLVDECPLHASALTFSTMMSIVPILALSLALARGFGTEQIAREKIRHSIDDWTSTFSSQSATGEVDVATGSVTGAVVEVVSPTEGTPPVEDELVLADEIQKLVDVAFDKVENISFTALGGVGLVLLLWMVVTVLGRVEAAFNRVWGVKKGRPLWRKFTDYLSAVFILPFLMLLASSLPVVDFATRFVNEDTAVFIRALLGSGFLKNATVLLMTSLTFMFILMFMPNTKIRWGAGLTGGLVTAALFLLWLSICAALQVFVGRYGRIYGSFAVVPILLAWVYISWEIVLFGAEVAFAIQNAETYRMEQGGERASAEARVLLALSVVGTAARSMLKRDDGFTIAAYARTHVIPVRFLNSVVEELIGLGFMAELSHRPGYFALLRSPEHTTVGEVVEGVLRSGTHPGRLGMGSVQPAVREAVSRAVNGMETSLAEMTLSDLSGVGKDGDA